MSGREEDKKTVVVHARLPLKIEEGLKDLVEEGYYSNISDALRDAARRLIAEHRHVVGGRRKPPRFELKEVEIPKTKKSKK